VRSGAAHGNVCADVRMIDKQPARASRGPGRASVDAAPSIKYRHRCWASSSHSKNQRFKEIKAGSRRSEDAIGCCRTPQRRPRTFKSSKKFKRRWRTEGRREAVNAVGVRPDIVAAAMIGPIDTRDRRHCVQAARGVVHSRRRGGGVRSAPRAHSRRASTLITSGWIVFFTFLLRI
jgi:hypothetical protein